MCKVSWNVSLLLAASCLFLSGCPEQSKPAATPQPLKPNVSPQAVERGTTRVAIDGTPLDNQQAEVATNTQPNNSPSPPKEDLGSGSNDTELAPKPGSQSPTVPLAEAIPKYETPIWEPLVILSQGHKKTCLVQVGDKFPALDVQTLAGEATNTGQLLSEAIDAGKRMAVVVFWEADDIYGREQFTRLGEEIIEPFEQAGVQVVAIHVGSTAEAVEQVQPQPAATVSILLDPEGKALAKVATEKLPRTYLLDAKGHVLWHDLEYSSGTRRDLRNAMLYHLTQQADAAE